MTTLDSLLAASDVVDGRINAHIDAGWMQGRTAYGGISAAVALDAVKRLHPTELPLRSALIAFVGPVAGECTIAARALRQSRTSLSAVAEVTSGAGYGTHALFTFSGDRASHIDHDRLAMPTAIRPDALEPVPPHPLRPGFTAKFDMRPTTGPRFDYRQDTADYITWIRFVDAPTCDPATALLAIADGLPPSAMALFDQFGPISTTNWTIHFLSDDLATEDGWWLIRSQSRYVRAGFSVQDLTIWNSAGRAVAAGGQGVGIYV